MMTARWTSALPGYLDTPPASFGPAPCQCTRADRSTIDETDCSCEDACSCHVEPNRIADALARIEATGRCAWCRMAPCTCDSVVDPRNVLPVYFAAEGVPC